MFVVTWFCRTFGEIMQTITYGRSQHGELDMLALGAAGNEIVNKTIRGYAVDIFPWRESLPYLVGPG